MKIVVGIAVLSCADGISILRRRQIPAMPGAVPGGALGGTGMGGGGPANCMGKMTQADCLVDTGCGWKKQQGVAGADFGECVGWRTDGGSWQSCQDWAASNTNTQHFAYTCGGPAPSPPSTAAAPSPTTAPCPACPTPTPCPACPACPTLPPPPTFYSGRTGDLVNDKDFRVTYPKTVEGGVPIVGALSFDGRHPATAAVHAYDVAGFSVNVHEPEECFDGRHTTEDIPWLVDTPGVHYTDEGLPYVVGLATLDPNVEWTQVTFPAEAKFTASSDQMVVLVNAINEIPSDWMALRPDKVSNTGFSFKADSEKRKAPKRAKEETVAYFAIQAGGGMIAAKKFVAGRTGRNVNHKWFKVDVGEKLTNPLVFAAMATLKGPDPSTLRVKRVKGDTSSFDVKVHETQGKCGFKPRHTTEDISYLVIST